MMRSLILLFNLIFWGVTVGVAQQYPEVWYDNSILGRRYANSVTFHQGDSWVKNYKQQLPVSNSVFFTPGNSLELKYTSALKGSWYADVSNDSRRNFRFQEGDYFTFKLLIQSETTPDELPGVVFLQGDSLHSQPIYVNKYIKNIEGSDWVSVEIPLDEVQGLKPEYGLKAIRFFQVAKDGKEHSLYIDQVEVLPWKLPGSPLTSPAILASASGYERHVDLTWTLPFTPSIRYIKIYRSTDNKEYYPVAIRPIFVKKYSDIVPEGNRTYFYRVAWVDHSYLESPLSNVIEVQTKELTDEDFINMVQKSSISLIRDGEEFNSGMQLVNLYSMVPNVSLRNTGAGLLALISEIKGDDAAKEMVFKRVEKVVSFLEKAENKFGAFPEILNGRTGKASLFRSGEGNTRVFSVDLESTAMMMQALLVAQSYFGKDTDTESQLYTRIEKLWREVQWNAFQKPGEPYLLNQWSSNSGFKSGIPLSGFAKRYIYVLALASPEYSISWEDYQQVVLNPLTIKNKGKLTDLNPSKSGLSIREGERSQSFIFSTDAFVGMEYVPTSYKNGNTYYGIPLEVGHVDIPLEDVLVGYLALDPNRIEDAYANYKENIGNLILIQQRMAMEKDIPLADSILNLTNGIAIFPFHKDLALQHIKQYYLKNAETVWSDYGFVGTVDFNKNKVTRYNHALDNAVIVTMINNAVTQQIWDLFSKVPGIQEVLDKPLDIKKANPAASLINSGTKGSVPFFLNADL